MVFFWLIYVSFDLVERSTSLILLNIISNEIFRKSVRLKAGSSMTAYTLALLTTDRSPLIASDGASVEYG
jgi:hypothetical protein